MKELTRQVLSVALASALIGGSAFAASRQAPQDPKDTTQQPPPSPSQSPDQKDQKDKDAKAQQGQQPVQQQDNVTPKNSKEDVEAIGNRGVGKGVNFYSLEKEIALGKQLPL